MELVKMLEREEILKEGSPIEKFLEKFDSNTLDATKDTVLFYSAMGEATLQSQESEDEDKMELWEEMSEDIEEYESLAYFISIRGFPDQNVFMVLDENRQEFGLWSGTFNRADAGKIAGNPKQITFMDMVPETGLKLMKGDPNTNSDYMRGDLVVDGTISLAIKPRTWISLFFEFLERDVE